MKLNRLIVAILVLSGTTLLQAKDVMYSTTGQTLLSTMSSIGVSPLAPGRYVVSVTPDLNAAVGQQLVEALQNLPGLQQVSAEPDRSTIHFTVTAKDQVRTMDIQRVVAGTDNNAAITTPMLEEPPTP